jgi:hypothetical protein
MEGGTSLADSVDSVGRALQGSPSNFELLQDRLAAAGYSPTHTEFYRDTRFFLGNVRIYSVSSDFPALTSAHLRQPLSPRVSNLAYSINLEGLPFIELRSWAKKLAANTALKRRGR